MIRIELLLFFVLFIYTNFCIGQEKNFILSSSKLNPDSTFAPGIYSEGYNSTIYINTDSTFKRPYLSCFGKYKEDDSGIWNINQDTLILKCDDSIYRRYLIDKGKLYPIVKTTFDIAHNAINKADDSTILLFSMFCYEKYYPSGRIKVKYSYSNEKNITNITGYHRNGNVAFIAILNDYEEPVGTLYHFNSAGNIEKETKHKSKKRKRRLTYPD